VSADSRRWGKGGVLNTYMAHIQGEFKLAHPSLHTVADAAYFAVLDFGYSKRTAFVWKETTGILPLPLPLPHPPPQNNTSLT
jgi:hypothetical protein